MALGYQSRTIVKSSRPSSASGSLPQPTEEKANIIINNIARNFFISQFLSPGDDFIFNQSDAKITINGGSFRSPLKDGVSVSSIETWGGELNISGGRFETGIETLQEGVSVNPSVGNTLVGPAISIAPKKDIAVNITGGTFYGKGTYAIYEKTVVDKISLSITIKIAISPSHDFPSLPYAL